MANGDNLIDEVQNLSKDGKLSPEATASLSLAALTDVLVVTRENKNDNVDIKKSIIEIKESVAILVTNQGTNKAEIDKLRTKSWVADAIAGAAAFVGIYLGVKK